MNRTVGLPAAIGVRYILEGRFTRTGVIVPVMPEFYEPALEELQRLGLQFTEGELPRPRRLGLDDPVARWLPHWRGRDRGAVTNWRSTGP